MLSCTFCFSKEQKMSKFLPSLTFCPWPVYKRQGFHFKIEDFHKNTFDLEDMFHPQTLRFCKNKTKYEIKTVMSIYYGKCFTLKNKVNKLLNQIILKNYQMKITSSLISQNQACAERTLCRA